MIAAVAVRTCAIAGAAPTELWRALSDSERARAAAMRNGAVQARFVVGRAALRALAGEILGIDAHRLTVATSPLGRPVLAEVPSAGVSVSATSDLVVVAIAPETRWLGVDTERTDRTAVPPLERWCSARERQLIARTPDPRRAVLILRLWTGKEALSKAFGTGIVTPLVDLEVLPAVTSGRAPPDAVRWLDLAPGHQIALAVWS